MSRRWQLLLLLFVGVVAVDQVTKYEAVAGLTRAFELEQARSFGDKLAIFLRAESLERIRTAPVPVFEAFWHFKYVENPGAAWGMFGGLDDGIRVPFFFATTTLAIGFLLLYFRRLPERERLLQVALALVLGGAVGNFIDRIARGYVIDFIDWHWRNQPDLHWPTFNVADIAICVGVTLLVAKSLFGRSPVADGQEPAEDGAPAPEPEAAAESKE